MLRTLLHYWRVNLAVVLGAAVVTAVLTGALLVGDSVRGSLRDLTLERLGAIDHALLTSRFLDADLAARLADQPQFSEHFDQLAPLIILRGSAVHGDSGARASQVTILGVDERFAALYGDAQLDFSRQSGQIFPSLIVNEALRAELGAAAGDPILLRFGRHSEVPRDTLMGERDSEDVTGSLRLQVVNVLPDRGIGRFGLAPNQKNPFNVYVALPQLQRTLRQADKINALFLSQRDAEADPAGLLASGVDFSDLGLKLDERDGFLSVESEQFVLRPNIEQALHDVAKRLGSASMAIQSYMATDMRVGERRLPYSSVAALDPSTAAWSRLVQPNGQPIDGIADDAIVLNSWAAEDLAAKPGDRLEMEYFVVGPREELTLETSTFTVSAIAKMEGLARDESLTPSYPGIQDAQNMADWDPPFPVDLDRVRPKDEQYWDRFGATPKAFVSNAAGRRLWTTRYGAATAIRVGPGSERTVSETRSELRQQLLATLTPDAFDLTFRPVKADGLAASQGATDFSGLFIGFSMFLIVSSALLVGLLFSLNVEQRSSQMGLLLAVGYPLSSVRRRLLGEGGLLAVFGALIGLAAGVGYAALLMAGLRTLWRPAVGSSALFLHIKPLSLVLGFLIAVGMVLLSILLSIRRLRRIPPPRLLAGSLREVGQFKPARFARWLAWGGTTIALGLSAYAWIAGQTASPGLAFGSGTLLLVAGVAFFSMWCRGTSQRKGRDHVSTTLGMAARNSSWNPARSVLSVALVATACFMIVAVGANRQEFGDELESRESGSGGFRLMAESDVPLYQNLNRDLDRANLGFADDESKLLETVEVMPFRFLPGDDTSCLNLYRPEQPRILGVPPEMIARGGFEFKQHLPLGESITNPWVLLDGDIEPDVVPAFGDANSMQWVLKLKLGEDLEIENEYGEPVKLRLVGTFARSLFQSELLISEAAFLEHFPSRTGYSYFLLDAPAAAAPEAVQSLERTLAPYGFDTTSTKEKIEAYQVVEHTYLSTFQTLGGLGLLLGTIGLGVILVRNVIERRKELATLRAFGFRRRRIGWLVIAENGFLLFTGMLIGTVAALAAVAPRLASIHVPWLSLLGTLVAVAAIGMLSCVVALGGAVRIPLLPALKADR